MEMAVTVSGLLEIHPFRQTVNRNYQSIQERIKLRRRFLKK